jgi:hypothetical protein
MITGNRNDLGELFGDLEKWAYFCSLNTVPRLTSIALNT